ncbi:MAG: SbcC/MukB-like Walker B domain-containing protein, partial [Bacteroidota bacterium]
KKEIERFKADLQKLRTEKAAFEKRVRGKSYDKAAHEALQAQTEALQTTIQVQNRELGSKKAAFLQLQADFRKRAKLLVEQSELQGRSENLEVLRGMFKASGFVNYVSTVYLQELCRRANARFRSLTRNRLRMEVTSDNNFVIRDMVNDGQLRSIKTLSGGQTFQAALSLALALADNIQERQQSRHNFFFLDEGFGTLDRNSLGIVFDTLKQLRRENRIVGVISHVEELQQEIDVFLEVRQDEARGSSIRGSWTL